LCKDLEVQGWHVCTEFFVVCLITLVGHVGAMVQYVKRRKYRNVDGEHGVGRGN
jgi:ribosomal silencing factor RsfS